MYQALRIQSLKETCLDVRATDEKGEQFIVEMQIEGNEFFGKRVMHYIVKSYVNQIETALKKGKEIGIKEGIRQIAT